MIEAVCRAQALVEVMGQCDAAGFFVRGRACSPSYRSRVEVAAAYMIDRVRDALTLPGEELEQFSTCRGLARILGCGRTAAWDIMQKFKALEFFAHRPILRRWQSNTKSFSDGSNPYWWMPTVWRMGQALSKIFADATRTGTDLADSPLGSHYRTRCTRGIFRSNFDGAEHIAQDNQCFVIETPTRPVSGKPTAIDGLIDGVNRMTAKLDAEDDRPPTLDEAELALRSAVEAVEQCRHPTSLDDRERLQRAVGALQKAKGYMDLAEIAARARPVQFKHVDPHAPPWRPGHR